MGRPSKTAKIIQLEGKSHRTKAEIEQRKKSEEAFISGIKLKEKDYVKNNIIAHKEFIRIQKLLTAIEKSDGLLENVVNRYCQIYSECVDFEDKRESFYNSLLSLEYEHTSKIENNEMTWIDYMKMKMSIQAQIINIDKQIHSKREMLLKIEKENLMTIAAALRVVPKKTEEKQNPYREMFE